MNEIEAGGSNIQEMVQVMEQDHKPPAMVDEQRADSNMPVASEQAPSSNAAAIEAQAQWLRQNMNNEVELLKFLDDPNNNLEDQPTDVLVALAQKLKERRQKHHVEMIEMQE